jgi:hypothetical protein
VPGSHTDLVTLVQHLNFYLETHHLNTDSVRVKFTGHNLKTSRRRHVCNCLLTNVTVYVRSRRFSTPNPTSRASAFRYLPPPKRKVKKKVRTTAILLFYTLGKKLEIKVLLPLLQLHKFMSTMLFSPTTILDKNTLDVPETAQRSYQISLKSVQKLKQEHTQHCTWCTQWRSTHFTKAFSTFQHIIRLHGTRLNAISVMPTKMYGLPCVDFHESSEMPNSNVCRSVVPNFAQTGQ